MERKKENQRCSSKTCPPPTPAPATLHGASICISNPPFRGRLMFRGGPRALTLYKEALRPERRLCWKSGLRWTWRSGCKWAVTALRSAIRSQQLLLHHWWLRPAEALQSQAEAFISAETGVARLPPASGWKDPCITAAPPVCRSCGFFVNWHALFCYSYKDSVFTRCCDLPYTNPLKKHK